MLSDQMGAEDSKPHSYWLLPSFLQQEAATIKSWFCRWMQIKNAAKLCKAVKPPHKVQAVDFVSGPPWYGFIGCDNKQSIAKHGPIDCEAGEYAHATATHSIGAACEQVCGATTLGVGGTLSKRSNPANCTKWYGTMNNPTTSPASTSRTQHERRYANSAGSLHSCCNATGNQS